MPSAGRTRSLAARVLWIAAPVALAAALAAVALWPRSRVLYSDGEKTWPSQPDLGLRSVLWDAGDALALQGQADQDYDPCLSGDGQELYFTRGKAGGTADLYVARRTLEGWGEPESVAGVNTAADEVGPALSRDGAALYFYSDRPGGLGGYDLYVSRRTDDGWAPPENLGPRVNSPFNEYDPALSPDGTHLLLASNRPVEQRGERDDNAWRATLREEAYQHDYDLYALDLADASARPVRLDAVSSGANDGQPALSPDGKWLYFTSDRPGGLGGYDLWRSRLTVEPLGGFLPPENLGPPVNTAANELDPAVSLEGFGLYFSSNRAGRDAYAIYYARSHEVFQIVRTERLAIGHILGKLSWPLIGLILVLAGLSLALLALARLRHRPGLLAGAMMISLILHLIALSLFTVWELSYRVSELAKEPARFEVAVAIPGLAESEMSGRLRAALADLARLDTAQLTVEKSEAPAAPEPPKPADPEVDLAAAEPVPRQIEIARAQDTPQELAEALRPQDTPAPTPDPVPPEPVEPVPEKPVRPAEQVRPLEPREVSVARVASAPADAAPAAPPPAAPERAQTPPELAPLALPDVRLQEVPAPPIEIAPASPEVAKAPDSLDVGPPAAEAPVRPARAAATPAADVPDARPLAAARAEAPSPKPAAVAPAVGAPARLGPEAVAMKPRQAARVADLPPGPSPAIDIETVAAGPPALPAPDAMGPVDLLAPAAAPAPRAVLPEAPPVAAGPREALAPSRPRQPDSPRAEPKAARAPAVAATLREPDAGTLLASTAARGASAATPVVGDSVIAAAVPPASPVDDVGAPMAPAEPKEIYRLRTAPDRKEAIEELGGTPETEEAVRKALLWFARHQSPDGRWDVDGFMGNYHEKGRRADGGGTRSEQDAGVTALATLAFLGSGHTHLPARGAPRPSEYAQTVRKAVDFLLAGQKPDGDLRQGGQIYDHCLATMALAESFSMTGEGRLAEPVRRAVAFLVDGQNPDAGWRYEPRTDNDTSVVGWALMALKSAEISGAAIPPKAYRGAANWLDKVRKGRQGGLYEYQPGRGPTPSMTAEGLFTQMLVGFQPASPRNLESVGYILGHLPGASRKEEDENLYYWYYATMALHQFGGPQWDEWNTRVRQVLIQAQRKDGPFAGSWDPRNRWDQSGGRLYATALGALTLEVYYRYLPFYDLRLADQADPAKTAKSR